MKLLSELKFTALALFGSLIIMAGVTISGDHLTVGSIVAGVGCSLAVFVGTRADRNESIYDR